MNRLRVFFYFYYSFLFVIGFYGVSGLKSVLKNVNYFQISSKQLLLIDILSFGMLALLFITLIKTNKVLRLLSALVINCYYGLIFYLADNTFHSVHPWLISSFFVAFIDHKNLNHPANTNISRIIPVLLLSHYFFSGLQKVMIPLSDFQEIPSVILNHYFLLTGGQQGLENSTLDLALRNFPTILIIGTFVVLLFELTAAIAIFNHSYRKYFVYGVVSFHCLTLVLLNIPFTFTPVALILMVSYIDYFFSSEESKYYDPT